MGWSNDDKIKISAFCLTTNSIVNQYPFLESIKSFLPVVDELIVIDGGSTDGTIEEIKNIGSSKIRIINDKWSKWENDWAYWRMGRNFDRGFQECTGDWVFKFDVDYILHEKSYEKFRKVYQWNGERLKLTSFFNRLNFILLDRYYTKSTKTFAVNKTLCKKLGYDVRFGIANDGRWGLLGYDAILYDGNPKNYRANIYYGELLRKKGTTIDSECLICNYSDSFSTREISKAKRIRHSNAEKKQVELNGHTRNTVIKGKKYNIVDWDCYKDYIVTKTDTSKKSVDIDFHPKIIQDKIKNLKKEQCGYDIWGTYEVASYYK